MRGEDVSYRRIDMDEIYEVIRRWHSHQKISKISESLSYDRKTVRKYIQHAEGKGISQNQTLPPKEELVLVFRDFTKQQGKKSKSQEIFNLYLEEIQELICNPKVGLKPKSAFQVIYEKYNLTGKTSYSSFKRWIKEKGFELNRKRKTCRIELAPGKEVQIDYAKMGYLTDPVTKSRRLVRAFIATLSHSRHKYVEFVYSQNQQSFVGSNINMFNYFNGVTERVVLDNLKTGVIKPDLYDPMLNKTYQEMGRHYECFLDPCRVGDPEGKDYISYCTSLKRLDRNSIILFLCPSFLPSFNFEINNGGLNS